MNQSRATESQSKERAQKVFVAIKQATENNTSNPFRVGTISEILRIGGFPLGSWEVRGEFTTLANAGFITLNTASAQWQLTESGTTTEKI